MASGPLLIAYDGSDRSEHALREGAAVLAERQALIVCVWEPAMVGLGPVGTTGVGAEVMPYPADVEMAVHFDEATVEMARETAQHGARIASQVGLDPRALAIADEAMSVADALLRLADEQDAAAIVIGSHGHGRFAELFGSTTRHVLRRANCPVLVARMRDDED